MFSGEYVSVLEIEDKGLFRSIVYSLMNETDENRERISLFEGEKELKISKNIMFITDMFSLDLNSKKIISAAVERLFNICTNDVSIANELEQLNKSIYQKINELFADMNSDFVISPEWNLSAYLKAFDFTAELPEAKDLLDKTIRLLQIASDLFSGTVICFINLKSILNDDEINEVYKFAMYNKLKILMLESTLKEQKISYEKKLLINQEFDEEVMA